MISCLIKLVSNLPVLLPVSLVSVSLLRLNDLFIDGLVHVSTLNNDYYQFDNVGQRLIGESSGQVYRLGDEVEVKVEAVSMDERTIDFSLISTTRKARNPWENSTCSCVKRGKDKKKCEQ